MNIIEITKEIIDKLAEVYSIPWRDEPWNEFFSTEEALAIILEDMDEPCFQGYLIMVDERIVGFTWGYVKSLPPSILQGFYIAEVGVLPSFQGQRIGRNLTETIISVSSRPIFLRTDLQAAHAISLYESLGFVPLESKRGYQIQDPEHSNRYYWVLR